MTDMKIEMSISYSLLALTLSLGIVGEISLANKHISIHKLLFLFLACPSILGSLTSTLVAQGMEMIEGWAVTFTCVCPYHNSLGVIGLLSCYRWGN